MNNTNWTPKINEIVKWQGNLYRVISINMSGECELATSQDGVTQIQSGIDISELISL